MPRDLYKVKVETELMVVANNAQEAVEIAKKNAVNEIANYGTGNASIIKSADDIPNDWKNVIPYAPIDAQETKKCCELVPLHRIGLEDEEINHIIKIQETKKEDVKINIKPEIRPEIRPDPVPPKLDWHDSKSGKPLQALRFIK